MRIALIRKNYNPYGGAENYLKLIAKELKTKGHDVFIYSAGNWPERSYQIHKVRAIKKPSFLSDILFSLNVRNALRKTNFDSILSFERTIFQDVYRAGDGCHREWLNKRKIVEPFFKKLSFILNPHHLTLLFLEKKCFLNSKTIIANSMMVKKNIIQHYSIPDGKIQVIYNGVDLQRFQPPEKEKKSALKEFFGIKEDKVILFVGADFRRKGLSTLLKAAALLNMRDKKVIVVGKRETAQYLFMAKQLGIDKKVIFWGAEQEIEKLYSIADVFVLPTIYDPFSNATLEAMASGLPVVTTSYNGASELIEDGLHGFIINNPLDTSTFAEKISYTLLGAEDMGKKARIKAKEYSIEKAVERIVEVISNH